MNTLCDVVVLTWNQLDIIRRLVESFLFNTSLPCRLIIIDNASNDATGDYLSSLQDTVNCHFEIVLNKENKGFVGGMNQGIELSGAPYVCLANNDLIFTKNWLEEIISVFEKYKNVGLLNPNSNNLGVKPPKGVPLEDFAQRLRSKDKGVFAEMPFCIGFCMVIKREVIDKVGGLSEEFSPMFSEDTDYSMKVRKAGFLIGVAKASYVWHQEHASFKQWPKEKEEVFLRSRKTFIKKWGKILRVAWVINENKGLNVQLEETVSLARKGNFIWVFLKSTNINREGTFKEAYKLKPVNFVNFINELSLFWKILRKKKKYDIIISPKPYISIFKFLKFIHKAEVIGIDDKVYIERAYNLRKFGL